MTQLQLQKRVEILIEQMQELLKERRATRIYG